jgi:hypothetical protein
MVKQREFNIISVMALEKNKSKKQTGRDVDRNVILNARFQLDMKLRTFDPDSGM